MQIRSRLRFVELLALHGLSQRKLAELAHVSQAFISLLSHGRRGARPETAWRIASALQVLAEELFVSKSAELEKTTPAPTTATPVDSRPLASTPSSTLATTRPPAPQRSTRFLTRHRPHWERSASSTHSRQPSQPRTCRAMVAAAA
ncbi:helix-turn-helix domain-containing protein [Streptomyces noursei]|uniref:helix-turn-helix transcriptional regulator n=1 Tax=Streptomyces noursei TaxID=1971 RepID=UPI000C99D2D4